METLENFANGIKKDLSVLINDTQRMIIDAENKDKKSKGSNKNTMMPVTTLYKDERDLKNSKENPEVDFIDKALDHIFGKYI